MKIVIVGPAHPLRGGIANFNEALASTLQQRGHSCVIVSYALQYPNFLFPGKTQYTSDPAPADLTIQTWLNAINPFNWLWTARQIRKMEPDLVIFRFWMPFFGPCLGTIARLVQSPRTTILALADNIIPHEQRFGDRVLSQYFLKACKGFVVLSKSVLEELHDLVKIKPEQAVFLPHPIYAIFGAFVEKKAARAHLNWDLTEGAKYILFFGFVRKYKGLDLLLDAMRDQRLRDLGIRLVVAGEFYEQEMELRQFIAQNDLSKQVVLVPDFIPSDEVKQYFCGADLVVQPYRTATQSGVTQIAYHFDRPMLVTNVGGLPEIVTDGKVGYVVEPESTAIANALFDFYDQKREADFTKGAGEEKKRFSWDRFAEGIEKLQAEGKSS